MENQNKIEQLDQIQKITDINNLSKPSKNYIADKIMNYLESFSESNDEQGDNLPLNDTLVTGDLNTKHGLSASLPYVKGFRPYWYARLVGYTPDEARNYVESNDVANNNIEFQEILAAQEANVAPNQDNIDLEEIIVPNQDNMDLMDLPEIIGAIDPNPEVPDDNLEIAPAGEINQEDFTQELNNRKEAMDYLPSIIYNSDNISVDLGYQLLGEGNMFFDDHSNIAHLIACDQVENENFRELNDIAKIAYSKSLNIDTHFNLFKSHHLSVLRLLYQTFPSSIREEYGGSIRGELLRAYKNYKYNYIDQQDGTNIHTDILTKIEPELNEKIYQLASHPYHETSLLKKGNLKELLSIFRLKLHQNEQITDDIIEKNYIFSDPHWVDKLRDYSNIKVNYADIYGTLPIHDNIERKLSIPEILDQYALAYMKRIYDPVNAAETIQSKMTVLTDMCMTASTEVSPQTLDTILTILQ